MKTLFRYLPIVVLTWLIASDPLPGMAQPSADKQEARVVILGTGTPNADPDRSGPCVAVIVGDTPYLVDAGPGLVRRAAAAGANGIAELRASNLRHVFITHLHTDHTVGLPDLIFTAWVLERDVPLQAYGPSGLQKMTDHLLSAYQEDIDMRLSGLEPVNPDGYKVEVHEIGPGVIYQDSNVTVEAILVDHGSWRQAFGYKFETSGRTIVISGDTGPSDRLVEAARGCDILVHEVYSQAGFEKREPVWQRYHSKFHTSTRELADLANQIKPGILVLYHQLYWGSDDEDLIREIKETYDGMVVSAHDLDVIPQ